MIGYRKGRSAQLKIVAPLVTIVMLSGLMITSSLSTAQAILIPLDEHWKYNIDWWTWDSDLQRTVGHINPTVIIQNQTADKLEGYIADANGTRLAMYQGEQVVMTSFVFENGMKSKWEIAGRIQDGYFTIDIPEIDRNAEYVSIFIGKNQYTVDNGTTITPQTWVFINSARIDYKLNSTISQVAEVAQEEVEPVVDVYHPGSLIDFILNQLGLLPIRGSNSGE